MILDLRDHSEEVKVWCLKEIKMKPIDQAISSSSSSSSSYQWKKLKCHLDPEHLEEVVSLHKVMKKLTILNNQSQEVLAEDQRLKETSKDQMTNQSHLKGEEEASLEEEDQSLRIMDGT